MNIIINKNETIKKVNKILSDIIICFEVENLKIMIIGSEGMLGHDLVDVLSVRTRS